MPFVRWDGSRLMVEVAVMQAEGASGFWTSRRLNSELKPGFYFLESLPAWFALEAIGD